MGSESIVHEAEGLVVANQSERSIDNRPLVEFY